MVWMDYSQNVKLTEKNQAQSAHFSGRQQTLHDSLIQFPGDEFLYIYTTYQMIPTMIVL